MTTKPIIEYYILFRESCRRTMNPESLCYYVRVLERFLLGFKNHKTHRKPDDFHRFDVLEYCQIRQAEGCSPTTINNDIRILRAFWNWLEARELASYNPTTGIKMEVPIPGRPPNDQLPIPSRDNLLPHCRDDRDRLMLYLCMASGLTRREILMLDWSHVNLNSRKFLLPDREVPIPEEIVALLLVPSSGPLLTHSNTNLRRWFGELCFRAGVQHVRPSLLIGMNG